MWFLSTMWMLYDFGEVASTMLAASAFRRSCQPSNITHAHQPLWFISGLSASTERLRAGTLCTGTIWKKCMPYCCFNGQLFSYACRAEYIGLPGPGCPDADVPPQDSPWHQIGSCPASRPVPLQLATFPLPFTTLMQPQAGNHASPRHAALKPIPLGHGWPPPPAP